MKSYVQFRTANLIGFISLLCIPQIVISGSTTSLFTTTTVPAGELVALNDIFNTMNGPNWPSKNNWGNGDPCTSAWAGVVCTNGSVTSLLLSANSLTGSFPSTLVGLRNLTTFSGYGNSIIGNISSIFSVFPPSLVSLWVWCFSFPKSSFPSISVKSLFIFWLFDITEMWPTTDFLVLFQLYQVQCSPCKSNDTNLCHFYLQNSPCSELIRKKKKIPPATVCPYFKEPGFELSHWPNPCFTNFNALFVSQLILLVITCPPRLRNLNLPSHSLKSIYILNHYGFSSVRFNQLSGPIPPIPSSMNLL